MSTNDNDMDTSCRGEILLVDDNKNDRELILLALKMNNFDKRVCVVKDGEEALEYIFATGRYASRPPFTLPKVIFLDLKLPKVSGLEALEKIKSHALTKTVPVVVFTSSQQEKDRHESYRLGTNSFVVKPINYEKFMEVVSELGVYWLQINQTQ